jgi:hypothetical protein
MEDHPWLEAAVTLGDGSALEGPFLAYDPGTNRMSA